MGLAEKRVIKSFQDEKFNQINEEINTIVGKKLEIDVNWESIAEEGMSNMYDEAWSKVYFNPLISALKNICSDDMGKEAISENLDKVVISNIEGTSNSSRWSKLNDKTLVLDHEPITNMDYEKDRADSLQKELEDNL